MYKIKFGTDGWRAVIGDEYTIENVNRLTEAVAAWLHQNFKNPRIAIGYDCRFNGKIFTETVSKVLAYKGIKVLISPSFTSTPAVSYAVVTLKADLGIVITASHNPPEYSGYKLKGQHGGPLQEAYLREVEALIPEQVSTDYSKINLSTFIENKQVEYLDIDKTYVDNIKAKFDIHAFENSKFKFAFDSMLGSGQNIMKAILPNIFHINDEVNPTFHQIPPEPLAKNLKKFSNFIAKEAHVDCGLAVDGDADRIALMDSQGNYIDSHHTILLLMHYLAGYKKQTGKIVTGFSSTTKVETLAKHYNLEVQRVKIGFKQISEVMLKEKVLVGGEESGGIAIDGHIPERDGIWNGMIIWQWMIETGKNIEALIQEIYDITGSFAYKRNDLKITDSLKNKVIDYCKNNDIKAFGEETVLRLETLDGFKYYLNEDEWIMIRPSGTEPVLRTYAEGKTTERAEHLIEVLKDFVFGLE
jgi:phosphomannomutase